MAQECEEIRELLVPYLNRRLLHDENVRVVSHLAQCEACRHETALLAKLRSELASMQPTVPEETMSAAFDLLPIAPEPAGLIASCIAPVGEAKRMMRDALSPVFAAVRLAMQV